jgi:hypothetical protein
MIEKPEPRRFPQPWSAEETDACFIVRDHKGQALAYVYFEEEPGRRAATRLMTRDEARRDRGEHREVAGVASALRRQPCQFRQRGLPHGLQK